MPEYARLTSGDAEDNQAVVDLVVVGGEAGLTGEAPTINNATAFADLPAAVVAYNALLAALWTRGVIKGA